MKNFVFWLAMVLLGLRLAAQDFAADEAFRNPTLTPEQRAADLVGRFTLQEKVLQMQNAAPAIARLGIPAYDWWNEALHGVARAGRATVFPQAIALAATWDTDLMQRVADAISTEARAKYNEAQRNDNHARYRGLTFWSPNINIFRDPRWGRGQETYGEDPFLTSRMAVAFIRGMQGADQHYLKTIATPKHFAVHSGPEPARHSFDVRPSEVDLEETYLPAFRASISEGQAGSVMCAYNRIDGVPACASSFLLQQQLRGMWGFSGYVVSDCGAVTDMVEGHRYAPTMAAAAAIAVKAGTDLTCGDEYASLAEAVQRGLISETEIDRALVRLFVARIRLGMFDPPELVPYAKILVSENDSPEHRQLALQAARESIVLLKNASVHSRSLHSQKPILPLQSVRRIAVIGPAADDPDVLLANYYGTPSHYVTPLAGIQKQFAGKAEIRFAQGSTFTSASPSLIPPDVLTPQPAEPAHSQATGDFHGLLAEYFLNPDLRGAAVLARVESRVCLLREAEDPEIEARVPRNGYSVRWSGVLVPPYDGEYQLGVVRVRCEDCLADDDAHVFLDDQLILDDANLPSASGRGKTVTLRLRRGRKHRLRVEYRQRIGGVGLKLVWIPPTQALLHEAVNTIRKSDVTIAFVGLNSELEGEEMPVSIPGFSGGDRTTLDLPTQQEELLEAASQTGKPLIVVLLSGSAVAVNFAQEHAAAVLESWYGGEEAGTAIAETLDGENNPAGRLPVTFYRSVADLPAFEDYRMRGRTYRYFTGKPWYPFGGGLSYSNFHYSDLHVQPGDRESAHLQVSAQVQNSSARAGDEVVQFYVSSDATSDEHPIRELRGFQRIHLAPGEIRAVNFELDREGLGSHAAREPQPALKFRLSIGGGQPIEKNNYVDGIF
ncbi:MAG: glycoside hydrolase family 3 N-terminal domain-containing protein [Candidatus Sulfotelmatobacter sp.]|jgi:beta-glucosidase